MLDLRTLQIMTGQSINLAHAELLQAKFITQDFKPIAAKDLQERSRDILIAMININNELVNITANLKKGV